MNKLNKAEVERLLGIYEPWSIEDIRLDPKAEVMRVDLVMLGERKVGSVLGAFNMHRRQTEDANARAHWHHIMLGRYKTVISAKKADVAPLLEYALTSVKARMPFIGELSKPYSFYVEQLVGMSIHRQMRVEDLSAVIHIDKALLQQVYADLKQSTLRVDRSTLIPQDGNPVWRKLLLGKVPLVSNYFPLKLLISQLKRRILERPGQNGYQKEVSELRAFFLQHVRELGHEITQLNDGMPSSAAMLDKPKKTLKVILPGINNPVWSRVISGELKIPSKNIPLNLLLSRMRLQWEKDNLKLGDEERLRFFRELRSFFYKNVRVLQSELLFLNQYLHDTASGGSTNILPSPDHVVWQKILSEEITIPHDHFGYSMLLSNLKTSLMGPENAGVRRNAATRLRLFLVQNQLVMKEQVQTIIAHAGLTAS